MPRLLIINQCLNLSTGRIAQQIGERAKENGWDCWIAFSGRESYRQSNLHTIKVGNFCDTLMHYITQRLFDNEGLNSSFYTKKFIKIIKAIRPDIIHLHNIHDHWLNHKLLFEYLNKTNIKIIWTFHDCWAFTGHCFHFEIKNCEKWKKECNKCPLQRVYPNTLTDHSSQNFELKKRLFNANTNMTIVACSEWMANLVRQSFLKEKRIEVINNGIDLSIFRPSKIKSHTHAFKVLAVSNVWNKEKGFEDVIKLRHILPAEFEITMVGVSQKQQRMLPSGIKGILRTHDVSELVDLYSSSDALINPTYADTFPTINIEALACGTPVITYNTGGSPEIVDEGTGFVVEQGNVEQLAQAIYNLNSTPLNSDDCRKRAELYYNKDNRFMDYINLYKNVVNVI